MPQKHLPIHEAVVPSFVLSADQAELQKTARHIAQTVAGPMAAETDQSEQYPIAVVDAMTSSGLMGMSVPTALGGPGRSYFEVALVVEELAAQCGVSGRIVVEGNMGAVGAIIAYGTPEQKRSQHNMS